MHTKYIKDGTTVLAFLLVILIVSLILGDNDTEEEKRMERTAAIIGIRTVSSIPVSVGLIRSITECKVIR